MRSCIAASSCANARSNGRARNRRMGYLQDGLEAAPTILTTPGFQDALGMEIHGSVDAAHGILGPRLKAGSQEAPPRETVVALGFQEVYRDGGQRLRHRNDRRSR